MRRKVPACDEIKVRLVILKSKLTAYLRRFYSKDTETAIHFPDQQRQKYKRIKSQVYYWMFLALYLHPVKYNAEKRIKNMPPTSTALSADAASGPSILNLMSAADVSFAWTTNKCLDFLFSGSADLELYRLLLLLWVSTPHVVLGSRHPVTRHMSRCVTHHTCHAHLREAGPWLSSVYRLVRPVTRLWAWPLVSSLLTMSLTMSLVPLGHNNNETCDFYNLELMYTMYYLRDGHWQLTGVHTPEMGTETCESRGLGGRTERRGLWSRVIITRPQPPPPISKHWTVTDCCVNDDNLSQLGPGAS